MLLTVSGQLKKKHSLSEVYEPENFQPFHVINDSLSQLKSTESVFITDFDKLETKGVFDFGIRAVRIWQFASTPRKMQVGLSAAFNRNGLVYTGKFPSLFRTELGLVIPFLKMDGESKFNLEIFRRWDNYSNFPNKNERLWGIRFNVPVSSR